MRRALDGVIAALRSFRGQKIDLLVGEPCFEPPAEIRAAFARIAGESVSGYGPPGGIPELREILAVSNGGHTTANEVMVTHGAKGGLLTLFAALVGPGDEVIHPLPCYPAYPAMVSRFGGVPVGVAEKGRDFGGWAEAVAAEMGPRTRAVVISSPSNPSGSVITGGDLAVLIATCRERGVRLILDEAYAAFRFRGAGVDPGRDPRDVLVRIGSASKSLALCGWRLGWVVADSELVARVTVAQSALLNPPATPPQRAMLALADVPDDYFEENRRAVRERLEALSATVGRAGFAATMPSGGFYLWIDVRDRLDAAVPDSAAWCRRLAEEHGVGFWPGEDYGAPGWVRLALPQGVAWRDDVRELGRRLQQ